MGNPTLQEILDLLNQYYEHDEYHFSAQNCNAANGHAEFNNDKALQAISAAMVSIIGTSTVERRHNPLTGEDIDLIDKAELKTNLNTFLGGGNER